MADEPDFSGLNLPDHYVLDERGEAKRVRFSEFVKIGGFMRNRRVEFTEVAPDVGVSTVLLPFDHRWGSSTPVLWETMVLGGPLDCQFDRCGGTREQALAMHENMIERVRAVLALAE